MSYDGLIEVFLLKDDVGIRVVLVLLDTWDYVSLHKLGGAIISLQTAFRGSGAG